MLSLITPPLPAVDITELKSALNIDHSDWDVKILRLIDAETAHLEAINGTAINPQTWEETLAGFPGVVSLPLRPLISVESIKYDDAADVETTLLADEYVVNTEYRTIETLSVWPATSSAVRSVRVRFIVGMEEGPDLESIKQAIILRVHRGLDALPDADFKNNERAAHDLAHRFRRMVV